jgi:hypothetical protein
MKRPAARLVSLLAALVSGACTTDEPCQRDLSYDPSIDPANFVANVDNPLFPLVPGTVFVYEGAPDEHGTRERVEVTVTAERKTILGVACTVVHDQVSLDGVVSEDTFDYYAQDATGAVWYFGEDTRELAGGKVTSTEGSWEAGVAGAKAGILIPAVPAVGAPYRQEYLACEAEDMAEVLAVAADASVPVGAFTGCLQTHDFTPLEPEANEEKYYCPNVGLVLTVDKTGGTREELVSKSP